MCLVDRKQIDLCPAEEIAEMRLAGPLWRGIEQVQLAIAKPLDGLFTVEIGAGQRGGADAIGRRRAQLIMHQGNQRADDHTGAALHDGGQLIGE